MRYMRQSHTIAILTGLLLLGFTSGSSAEDETGMSFDERIKKLENELAALKVIIKYNSHTQV